MDRIGQIGHSEIGRQQRDTSVRRQAVMGKPLVAGALVRPRDAQRTYRPSAKDASSIHHLAGFDPGKPPPSSGPKISRPLADDGDVGPELSAPR